MLNDNNCDKRNTVLVGVEPSCKMLVSFPLFLGWSASFPSASCHQARVDGAGKPQSFSSLTC